MAQYDARTESFEEITLFGKPALFTSIRLDSASIPDGYHKYEIRHDDDCSGDAVEIAPRIVVNHWGSVITNEPIIFTEDGFSLMEDTDINYCVGECNTLETFMAKYPPVLSNQDA